MTLRPSGALNRLVDAALGEYEHSGGVAELVELGAWELAGAVGAADC